MNTSNLGRLWPGLMLGAALGCTGCAETWDEAGDARQSPMTLLVTMPRDAAAGSAALGFGYARTEGWHFRELTAASFATPGGATLQSRTAGLGKGEGLDLKLTTPSRFDVRFPAPSELAVQTPAASGFAVSPTQTGAVFSARAVPPGRFRTGMAGGIGSMCSLRGFCDYAQLACLTSRGPSFGEGCRPADLASCYDEADQSAMSVSASNLPLLCTYSELFDCLSDARATTQNMRQLRLRCEPQIRRLREMTGTDPTLDAVDEELPGEFEF